MGKAVYLVVYQDGQTIRERVQKICDSFMGQRFEIPSFSSIQSQGQETKNDIEKAENLLVTSEQQLRDYLKQINKIQGERSEMTHYSALEVYLWFVAKEKAIYNALN